MPGLAEMTSQFQPGATQAGDALAEGGGLENVTNAGSTLNIDANPILSNALAEASPYDGLAQSGEGLENVTNAGSVLNVDGEPTNISNGLANGVGLEAMASNDSDLDIDTNPLATSGEANLSLINSGWDLSYGAGGGIASLGATNSTFDIDGAPNDMSDGLASGNG